MTAETALQAAADAMEGANTTLGTLVSDIQGQKTSVDASAVQVASDAAQVASDKVAVDDAYNIIVGIQGDLETLTVETDATTARTLTAADNGKAIFFTAGTDITLTLPAVVTENLPDGFGCVLIQEGAGQVVVVKGDAGDTVQAYLGGDRTAGQFAQATIVKKGDDGTNSTWQFAGEIV